MSMTKQEACVFLQDLAERLRHVPAQWTDDCDIDQLREIAELIPTDFGIPDERVEEVIRRMNGPKESFRSIITDRNELLAKVCDYADILADRRRTEPWVIMGEIFGHGSGVSSAIFQIYRREG